MAKKALVSVELFEGGEKVVLRDLPEAVEWFTKQERELAWISQVGGPPSNLWQAIHSHLTEGRSLANQILTAGRQPTESELAQILARVKMTFGQIRIFAPSAPERKFLASLLPQDRSVAGWCAFYLQSPTEQVQANSASIKGFIQAQLFRLGDIHLVDPAERAQLASARADWSTFQGSARDEHVELAGDYRSLAKEIWDTQAEQRTTFDGITEAAEKRLAELERVFNEKLALKEPATYWSNRARSQGIAASIWSAVFLTTSTTAVFGLWQLGQALGFSVLATEEPQIWKVATLIAAAALVAWPLRIVARLIVSSLHARADALERTTMVTTYLSLIQDPQAGLTEQDRSLFLAALFRPASTGIVADDAAPASSWDLLSRLLGGKG